MNTNDNKPTTALRAFEKAQQTGKIAITIETAIFFSELLRMDEAFMNIVDVLGVLYPPETQDRILEELIDAYSPFYNMAIKQWQNMILDKAIKEKQFKGI
jgi:hypothetical protein